NVAEAGEWGCCRGGRNHTFEAAGTTHRHMLAGGAARIDDTADPGSRRAQDRQAFLDRPQSRLREVLGRSEDTEPAVVRIVEDVVGPMIAIDHLTGEHDLVADLHAGPAPCTEIERARPRPGDEVDRT